LAKGGKALGKNTEERRKGKNIGGKTGAETEERESQTRHKRGCPCIFCNSKCPECGSLDIRVDFGASLFYENRYIDAIIFEMENILRVKMKCFACGKTFGEENSRKLKRALKLHGEMALCTIVIRPHKKGGYVLARQSSGVFEIRESKIPC
jgi:hypothetical protein